MSCPICYQNYSNEVKEVGKCKTPFVEECRHTVCLECLNSIADLPYEQHRCPICREDWEDFIDQYILANRPIDESTINPDYSICCPVFAHMPLHTISILDAFYEHKHRMINLINPLIRLRQYNRVTIIINNEDDIRNIAYDIVRNVNF